MKKGLLVVLLAVMMMGFVFGQGATEKGFVTVHDAYGSVSYYTPGPYNTDVYVSNNPCYSNTVFVESYPQYYANYPVCTVSYPSSNIEVISYQYAPAYTTCSAYNTEVVYYPSEYVVCESTQYYTCGTTVYNSYPTHTYTYMGF